MNSIVLIFASFLLLAILHSTIAINCYKCTAGTEGCNAYAFNKGGSGVIATSDSTAAYCTKITYASNNAAAERSYATSGSCSASTTTTNGLTQTTSCCTTDLCNNAHGRTASIIVAMITTILVLFFTK
ncbi:hypothetical protein I4U23_027156 [Adineta vaga]|nr:hypothetical protein I4U23_027156 [Adineta vaga]